LETLHGDVGFEWADVAGILSSSERTVRFQLFSLTAPAAHIKLVNKNYCDLKWTILEHQLLCAPEVLGNLLYQAELSESMSKWCFNSKVNAVWQAWGCNRANTANFVICPTHS